MKKTTVTKEEFESALDVALYNAMTNGVPLMSRGEPILDIDDQPIMVAPGADILSVAERRAKAKQSSDPSNTKPSLEIVAEILGKALEAGTDLPPEVGENENERE